MQYALIAMVALALIGGGFYYTTTTSSSSKEQEASSQSESMSTMGGEHTMDGGTMMSDEDHAMMMEIDEAKGSAMMTEQGVYETYAVEKLARATHGPVVLFFRASWCPTCQAADKDIRANQTGIPSGVSILDVDYDNSSELKRKYGVTYQHTFVQVDASGNQIHKWSGSRTLSEIVKNIKL